MVMPPSFGPFARSEETIADFLVKSAWFSKFTNETEPAIMRKRIYFDKTPTLPADEDGALRFDDMVNQRPFVCLWPAQPSGIAGRRIAQPNSSRIGIDFQLYFETNVSEARKHYPQIEPHKTEESFHWWSSLIGVILFGDSQLELTGLLDQPNFAVQNISQIDLWHTKAQGLGSFFAAMATVSVGGAA